MIYFCLATHICLTFVPLQRSISFAVTRCRCCSSSSSSRFVLLQLSVFSTRCRLSDHARTAFCMHASFGKMHIFVLSFSICIVLVLFKLSIVSTHHGASFMSYQSPSLCMAITVLSFIHQTAHSRANTGLV